MPDFDGADVGHAHSAAQNQAKDGQIVGAEAGASGRKDVDVVGLGLNAEPAVIFKQIVEMTG